MESQYWNDEVQQSAWLLDYDRRCMLDCADTFQNLAAVMGEMNWELEQEKTPDDREELLRRRQAMESRKQYAAHMRFRAEMLHMRMLIKPNKACLLTSRRNYTRKYTYKSLRFLRHSHR